MAKAPTKSSTNEFSSGDIVVLKSGGPEMTVRAYAPTQQAFLCQWFAGKKLEQGYFKGESLSVPTPKP